MLDSPSAIDRFVNAANPEAGGGFRQPDRKDERMNSEHQDPSNGPKQNRPEEIDYFSLVGFNNLERENGAEGGFLGVKSSVRTGCSAFDRRMCDAG